MRQLLNRSRDARRRWEGRYARFARARGFESFNDARYHWRGFVQCWAEPGFHRFWRVWNPGIAYFVHGLYIRLGGRKRFALPTIAAFTISGLVHTLVVVPFLRRWSFAVIVAFAVFGVLTVLSRYASAALRQDRWPMILNIAVNVGLVIGAFDLGFRVDHVLR
jgi:hypothetical protein